MPLISALKNDALRPRHWKEIQETVGQTFDHQEEKFTLDLIIAFGFDAFADKINDISGAASKELSIEKALNAIAELWAETKLELGPYKDKGHFKLKYEFRKTFIFSQILFFVTIFTKLLFLQTRFSALDKPSLDSTIKFFINAQNASIKRFQSHFDRFLRCVSKNYFF